MVGYFKFYWKIKIGLQLHSDKNEALQEAKYYT